MMLIRGAFDYFKSIATRPIVPPTLLQTTVVATWALILALFIAWLLETTRPHTDNNIAVVIALGLLVAVPKLITIGITLIPTRLFEDSQKNFFDDIGLTTYSSYLPDVPRSLYCRERGKLSAHECRGTLETLARQAWNYERTRSRQVVSNIRQYTGLYGAAVSFSLAVCIICILLISDSGHIGAKLSLTMLVEMCRTRFVGQVAFAVLIAILVSFLVASVTFVRRTALNDLSARAVAAAMSNSLDSGIAALGVLALLKGGGYKLLMFEAGKPYPELVVGLAAALFGGKILELLSDKFRQLLGLPARIKEGSAQDLNQIDGISEADASRLAEEGIYTVHHLAFYPTARLFYMTQYSLAAICDWQDQALLIAYVGRERAEVFRRALLVRGATDAQNLLGAHLVEDCSNTPPVPTNTTDTVAHRLSALLGFPTPELARLALQDLAMSGIVWRVGFYQAAVEPKFCSATDIDNNAKTCCRVDGAPEPKVPNIPHTEESATEE